MVSAKQEQTCFPILESVDRTAHSRAVASCWPDDEGEPEQVSLSEKLESAVDSVSTNRRLVGMLKGVRTLFVAILFAGVLCFTLQLLYNVGENH